MKTNSLIYYRIWLCNLHLSVCLKVRAHRGGEGSGYTNASWLLEDTHAHASSHTVSCSLSLTHTLVSWYPCTGLKHHPGLVLLCPCNLRAVCCLSLGKSLVSKNKLKPCTIAEGPTEVKQWQSNKFQSKLLCYEICSITFWRNWLVAGKLILGNWYYRIFSGIGSIMHTVILALLLTQLMCVFS